MDIPCSEKQHYTHTVPWWSNYQWKYQNRKNNTTRTLYLGGIIVNGHPWIRKTKTKKKNKQTKRKEKKTLYTCTLFTWINDK